MMNMKNIVVVTLALIALAGCSSKNEQTSLKDAYKDYCYIGAAIDRDQIAGKDSAATQLLLTQFNSIVAENVMKWERIHPQMDSFVFAPVDSFVELGLKNKMFIVGHCLCWHSQVAPYVFVDAKGKDVSKDTLLARLKSHITTVVSRYKGKVNGYDVVNEALNEDGTLRQSKWYQIAGEEYIEKAFQYAHEADSSAELYYNDYNIEQPAKRAGAIKLIKSLQAKGIKVSGVGIQGHWHVNSPSMSVVDSAITDFAKLGVKVMFTELDFTVIPNPWDNNNANIADTFAFKKEMNPYAEGLPDSVQQKLANRYADFFTVVAKHKGEVSRVTFWGLHDGQSWLNNWPIFGRTNYPLPFDKKMQPKPAYYSILNVVSK
jgi:endo-1,4-beta-xylanase